MAIYIYKTVDGTLVSYCPNDTDPVASAGTLTANGLTATTGLSPIGPTTIWDAPTKTTKTITAPKSVVSVLAFWQRFTAVEREALEGSYQTGTQAVKNAIGAFRNYIMSVPQVDINDPYIQAKVTQMETVGIIAAGRAAQVLV